MLYPLLDILYGFGADIMGGRTYMAHRTGFTVKTLSAKVAAAGFASHIARRRPNRYDLWTVATKSRTDQATLREMLAEYGTN